MGELISLKTTNSSAKNNGEYTDTSTSKYNLDNNYSEYFKKLAKEPLLTKQEEQTLAKNIESEARSLMQVICSYKNSKEELEGLNILEQKIYAKLSEKEKVKVAYKLEKQEGPDHKKEFIVAVFVKGNKIAEAKASSKKEAEQKAAKKAIKIVF